MNYNLAAYIIYLSVTLFVIFYVGKRFHTTGRIFILSLFDDGAGIADYINNILLLAYYLFNMGYAFVTLRYWQRIADFETIFASVSRNIGTLLFILAVTHYFNIVLIYHFSKSRKIIHHN